MPVRIEKSFRVKEPIEKVWNFLSDPRRVVTCVPGAQITEAVNERTYLGSISVKVGPSVTDYKGEVTIERLDPRNREMELVGRGKDVLGKGSASMKMTGKLRALAEGGTEVTGISEVNVVGVLAQFGSRMIHEVSNQIFAEFTANFERQLQRVPESSKGETLAVPPQPIRVIPLVLSALWAPVARFFRRIFGGPTRS